MSEKSLSSDHLADQLAAEVAAVLRQREPTSEAWGIRLLEARLGYARIQMQVRADMLNGHATLHGGIIFAFADSAFAYACNSANAIAVAAQASIIFLTPAREGETLIAEARELGSAGRSGSYAVHVSTVDGRAVADFQGLSRVVGGPIIT